MLVYCDIFLFEMKNVNWAVVFFMSVIRDDYNRMDRETKQTNKNKHTPVKNLQLENVKYSP